MEKTMKGKPLRILLARAALALALGVALVTTKGRTVEAQIGAAADKAGSALENAAEKTGAGVERAAEKTGAGIEKAFDKTSSGLERAGAAIAEATGAVSGEVPVSAAASLTGSFKEIATAFHTAHPGATAAMNFAGSPTLVQQILEGAPVDVFASADEPNMKKVVDAGKVAGTPRVFARNHLAIAVAKGNPKKIESLADLAKPGLTVSLCAPTVPAGRYARDAFAKAGVAVPKSSEELDVKAALSRVVMGEADAAVVYVTDVRAGGADVVGIEIPAKHNVEARYPIAVLKDAKSGAAANAFVIFVLGANGQAILRKAGFLAP